MRDIPSPCVVVMGLLVACQCSLGIIPVLFVGLEVSLPVLVPHQLSLQLCHHMPLFDLESGIHRQLTLLMLLACTDYMKGPDPSCNLLHNT